MRYDQSRQAAGFNHTRQMIDTVRTVIWIESGVCVRNSRIALRDDVIIERHEMYVLRPRRVRVRVAQNKSHNDGDQTQHGPFFITLS